jgi:hypothetical protein
MCHCRDDGYAQRGTRVTGVLLALRPKPFVDFHMGAIGGCSDRKARSWMMRRIFRFCQNPIEWNYFSADLAGSAAADRTLFFRPRSSLI